MTRRLVIALLLSATFALAAPDFSGSWKINAAKSKSGGQFPLPQRFERKVTHADPSLAVTTVRTGFQGGEDITQDVKYSTDGKETTNPFFGDAQMKSTAKWQGDVLAINSTASTPNGDFTITERWTLSADAKSLEIVTKVSGGFGEFESTYVLDKQ